MSESNKALQRRMLEEVFTQGRYEVLAELVTPSFVMHDPAIPMSGTGPAAIRQVVEMLRSAFPDLRMTIEDQIAEGNRVVTRWSSRGTHRGSFMGKAPTGRSASVTGTTIDRIENGKIAEGWVNWDSAGLLQQLGLRMDGDAARVAGDGGRTAQPR